MLNVYKKQTEMKKLFLISTAVLSLTIQHEQANAQFDKLLDFNNTNGTQPFGSVILSSNDSVLYGMTNGGGAITNSAGVIFSINTDGSSYQNLHTFTTDATSGSWPYGSLMRSGNVLYGMTSGYGLYNDGTIFSINTNGSGYVKLHDFQNGGSPNGTLAISGSVLYGMTYYGGTNNKGAIFSVHTDGTSYKTLLDFNGANGQFPGYGALIQSGKTLIGTTLYGGTNGSGVIFSVDTDGTNYNKILDFNNANGSMPFFTPILSGNVLYGGCGGGAYAKGVIYSIHTDGTGYEKLFDFNGTNGQGPNGGLMLSGNILYGTTGGGGTYNKGTIFRIDTTGNGFQTLFNFNVPDGTQPRATLSLSGGMLYGTAVTDGTYGSGTVFSFETQPAAIPICMVTVDDSSKYNHIVWQKPVTTAIDSFIVYREITTNNYKPIGAQPYSALSEFVDTVRMKYFPFTGDPNAGTFRYKLQFRDTSGNYSELSPYHNTIFVTQSGGTFNWNQYAIEGDSIPLSFLSAYVLYRDDNGTGSWNAVQGVSGSQTTVTDPNYASFPNGKWRVETTWGITCTPTMKNQNSYNSSLSNIYTTATTGINGINITPQISIYPNPNNGKFIIAFHSSDIGHRSSVIIYNIFGEAVCQSPITNDQMTIDLHNQPSGIYFYHLLTSGGKTRSGKIAVEK